MFEKKDFRRIYWLIDQYLNQKIDSRTFCDEFYYCYDLEVDRSTLCPSEKKLFSELSTIANRFSEFSEDHVSYPDTYFTEDQVRQKAIEISKSLSIDNA